ncbi:MAG: hypothetical protein KAI75_07115 [Desulfobulbaceae bacterium]|nr:hypothetical protein [Desulfobulbaceae bacterium]
MRSTIDATFLQTVQRNCDISDARDNGIYSICSLVLKLRNLYKWEHNIEPWAEPDPPDLLDWIEVKENYWDTIVDDSFQSISISGNDINPYDSSAINRTLEQTDLVYGAGYGRSMKSIFFLAEKISEDTVEGCPVQILGREKVREIDSPFAMLQDGLITIRRDPLRFFFWDHIQEIRSSSKASLYLALDHYGLLADGKLDQVLFRDRLDTVVDQEIPIFIYHEVGEMLQKTLDSGTQKKIISAFPDSAVEFVARSLKDVLADTHPHGMINFIIQERRLASLGFYVGFLGGLRKVLFPEISCAFKEFRKSGDWALIEKARCECREKNRRLAERLREIAQEIDQEPADHVQSRINQEILTPLEIDVPEG